MGHGSQLRKGIKLPKGREVMCKGHIVDELSTEIGYFVQFGKFQAIVPYELIMVDVPEDSKLEMRLMHGSAHTRQQQQQQHPSPKEE